MGTEISQICDAIEAYREKFGEYPPDGTDPQAVRRHLAIAFPSYKGELPPKYANLDPATSLVFWLGGCTDHKGGLIGFSSNRSNPFEDDRSSRIPPFYDFDYARLRSENGMLAYLPRNGKSDSDPHVYFRPDSNGQYRGAWKQCRPCRDTRSGGWMAPKTYQLFCPGWDGRYGSGVQYPTGEDYDKDRYDDIANFSSRDLEGDMP
jgi:hypothetical protein